MATKNYVISGKKIIAKVAALKPAEMRVIKKYLEMGFELEEAKAEVLTAEQKHERAEARKAAKQEEAEKNPYSKLNVEKFLKAKGNEELFKEYEARYNEQAGTNNRRKDKNGVTQNLKDTPKFLIDGTPKKKGFANCIGWFKAKFTYNPETKTYEANA